MRIGIVGGIDRSQAELERVASKAGHRVEFHTGHLRGPSAAALESLINRSDVVVLVTDINSHNAILQAKAILKRAGREGVYLRKAGVTRFRELLEQLPQTAAPAARRAA